MSSHPVHYPTKTRLTFAAVVLLAFAAGVALGWALTWGGNIRWQLAYSSLQTRHEAVIEQANTAIERLQAQIPKPVAQPEE